MAPDQSAAHATHGRGTHQSVMKRILEDIDKLAPDTQLESSEKLAQQYGVAKNTVIKAIEKLKDEHWLYSIPAVGVYVDPRRGEKPRTSSSGSDAETLSRITAAIERLDHRMSTLEAMFGVSSPHPQGDQAAEPDR